MRLAAAFTNIPRNYASISGQNGEIITSFLSKKQSAFLICKKKKSNCFFLYAIQERFIGKLNSFKRFNRYGFSVKANLEMSCQAIHFPTHKRHEQLTMNR